MGAVCCMSVVCRVGVVVLCLGFNVVCVWVVCVCCISGVLCVGWRMFHMGVTCCMLCYK